MVLFDNEMGEGLDGPGEQVRMIINDPEVRMSGAPLINKS
jgi:hypothetical protein